MNGIPLSWEDGSVNKFYIEMLMGIGRFDKK
jgi:hypothetical protein